MVARRILALGASGLIGRAVAADLARRGHAVVAAARRFTAAQRAQFASMAREIPLADLPDGQWRELISDTDIVVNCIGLLQDQPGNTTRRVHEAFLSRLIAALRAAGRPILFVHFSIPGDPNCDRTDFSLTKRNAERAISLSGLPYAILRPGFVFAPGAYGGSALLRAFAALPLNLPSLESARPLAVVAIEDVTATVAHLAERWEPAVPHALHWDLMHPRPYTVGGVIAALRRWLGDTWPYHVTLPRWLLALGAG